MRGRVRPITILIWWWAWRLTRLLLQRGNKKCPLPQISSGERAFELLVP